MISHDYRRGQDPATVEEPSRGGRRSGANKNEHGLQGWRLQFPVISSRLQWGHAIFLTIPTVTNKWTQRRRLRHQRPRDRELLSQPPPNHDFHGEIRCEPSRLRSRRWDSSRPLLIAISSARFIATSSESRSPLRDTSQRWYWRSRRRWDPGLCRRPVAGVVTVTVVISSQQGEIHIRRERREILKGILGFLLLVFTLLMLFSHITLNSAIILKL